MNMENKFTVAGFSTQEGGKAVIEYEVALL